MSIRLSIIIPCYNCADTLRSAVATCYTQGLSHDEFEIVMVNDCSTDTTAVVMNELARQYENIRTVSHEKNRGGGATRNTAIEHTEAEVIFCLDSDDLLPPNTLSKMLAYLEQKKCDGVCFEKSIKFRGNDVSAVECIDQFPFTEAGVPFESLIEWPASPVMVVFMFTKQAWRNVNGYPTHHGFDTQGFGWRFLSAGYKVLVCRDTTYLHRVKYKQSYYQREYNAGKTNYHLRAILEEHALLFTEEANAFVRSFDCTDFTRDLGSELFKRKSILVKNYQQLFGTLSYDNTPRQTTIKFVSRHSPRGIVKRIRAKIKRHSL
jgi:glycosyltransferase involved in cell wall biosynthesis